MPAVRLSHVPSRGSCGEGRLPMGFHLPFPLRIQGVPERRKRRSCRFRVSPTAFYGRHPKGRSDLRGWKCEHLPLPGRESTKLGAHKSMPGQAEGVPASWGFGVTDEISGSPTKASITQRLASLTPGNWVSEDASTFPAENAREPPRVRSPLAKRRW